MRRTRLAQAAPIHQCTYSAGSWAREENVIARVGDSEMASDARLVTNLTGRAKVLYEKVYCARPQLLPSVRMAALKKSRWRSATFAMIRAGA